MEMPKLLIAGSCEFSHNIALALRGSMDIQCCQSGRQALTLLRISQPDILLIDLFLPEMDGLTVLQSAAAEQIQPRTVVTLDLQTPYILDALSKLQISYAFMKPCDTQAVLAHLSDIAATLQSEPEPVSAEPRSCQTMAATVLRELGMNPKWNGFHCLLLGIPQFYDDTRQAVTKELYIDIGKHFGKSGMLIERNIRSAIHKSWALGDMAVWRKYFPVAPDGTVPRPSNKAFIAHMAQILYAENRQWVG